MGPVTPPASVALGLWVSSDGRIDGPANRRGGSWGNDQQADREALDRLERGDPSGFDLAYDRHRDRVYAFLFRLTGRADLADDLFQETWLRFSRQAASLCDGSNLRSWLFTVARHLFVSHLRHERAREAGRTTGRCPATAEVDAFGVNLPNTVLSTSSAEHGLALSELERALLALSVEDRELLLLVSVEGLKQNEVAAVLGVAAAAIRQRVTRARARLAAILDAETNP
jgi:RNA polymerase sigma-70 factor (ECF subfamily)